MNDIIVHEVNSRVGYVDDIIPFHIFHREHEDKYLSYVQNSVKKNNSDTLTYVDIPKTVFYKSFYAINPMFRPIPPKTNIVCFKQNNTFPFNVVDVFILYDPYDIEGAKDSVCCITWLTPVPNTIPLYLYKNYIGIYCSFEKNEKYGIELDLSPIYVMEKEIKHFKYDMGRCLPSLDTSYPTLNQCELKNDLSLQKEITIFDIIKPKKHFLNNLSINIVIITFLILFIFYIYNKVHSPPSRNTLHDTNRNNFLEYRNTYYPILRDI
jgi:hypothetical protein